MFLVKNNDSSLISFCCCCGPNVILPYILRYGLGGGHKWQHYGDCLACGEVRDTIQGLIHVRQVFYPDLSEAPGLVLDPNCGLTEDLSITTLSLHCTPHPLVSGFGKLYLPCRRCFKGPSCSQSGGILPISTLKLLLNLGRE